MHTDDRKRGVGENLLSANSCVQACVCAGNYIFPLVRSRSSARDNLNRKHANWPETSNANAAGMLSGDGAAFCLRLIYAKVKQFIFWWKLRGYLMEFFEYFGESCENLLLIFNFHF